MGHDGHSFPMSESPHPPPTRQAHPESSEEELQQLRHDVESGALDFLFFWKTGGAGDDTAVAPEFWTTHRPYLIKRSDSKQPLINEYDEVPPLASVALYMIHAERHLALTSTPIAPTTPRCRRCGGSWRCGRCRRWRTRCGSPRRPRA